VDYESLLEFDINATMLNIGCEAGFANERFLLSFNAAQSIAEHGGTLRDRDWEFTDYYTLLFGDTDSDVDSEGEIYDLLFQWNFLRFGPRGFLKLWARAGYEYQEWGTFVAKDYKGFYLNDNGTRRYVAEHFSSAILTYDVEYAIAYSGIGVEFNLRDIWFFRATADFGIAYAEDRDDHVLRQKLATAEADGPYAALNLSAYWNVSRFFRLSSFLDFVAIDTDGTQEQWFYDDNGYPTEWIGEVSNEITSEQYTFGIRATLRV
jgi:hypothetical protein